MPLSLTELIIAWVIMIGIAVAVVWANRRRRGAGWWILGAVVLLVVVGNALEQAIR